jgi:hypothetical protein
LPYLRKVCGKVRSPDNMVRSPIFSDRE